MKPALTAILSGSAPAARRHARAAAALGLALLAAACGSRSDDGREPSDPVAAIAWQEWRRFGGSTVVYGSGNGNGGHPGRPGIKEDVEPAASRIGEYWRLAGRPEWTGRDTDKPWSGAFVAWVMARAGVPAAEFPRGGRHALYLNAIADRQRWLGSPRFRLRDIAEYAPQPGDLVCTGRGPNVARLTDPERRREAIDRHVEHCDIVIEVRQPFLHAVGGNVRDTVTLSLYPVDSRGRVLPVNGRSWFVAVERRG